MPNSDLPEVLLGRARSEFAYRRRGLEKWEYSIEFEESPFFLVT